MARTTKWFAACRLSFLACVLAAAPPPTLGGQSSTYDSTVVSVSGSGPATYVLLSGIVGGVPGFRRLASLLEPTSRVVIIDPYRLHVDSADVTFTALARTVDAVLEYHGIDSARVVGHAHGAGVALRLAANAPRRVSALYFLDVGALAENQTRVFSASLKLAPMISRLPGGRGFVRGRIANGIRQNAGHQDWLDAATLRGYTEPFLSELPKVVAMAGRLSRAREPESRLTLVERLQVPVTVLLGAVPHPAEPDPSDLTVLAPLGVRLRIERLDGVGHFPHEEAAARVAEYLLAPVQASRVSGRRQPKAVASQSSGVSSH